MIYNDSQKKAVMHTTGPMMVLAGPGSGKTAVITGRTCQLVTSGISASRILVVTFTRAAAKEMKERYLKAMGKTSTQVTFGTFHGVFYAILRHTYRMSGNNILSEKETFALHHQIVEIEFFVLLPPFLIRLIDFAELFLRHTGGIVMFQRDLIVLHSADFARQIFLEILFLQVSGIVVDQLAHQPLFLFLA